MSEQIFEKYSKLAKIPALISGKILLNASTVHSLWTQRNVECSKLLKYSKTSFLSTDLEKLGETLPNDVSDEVLCTISPTGNLKAVLKTRNGKQFLEIWQKNYLSRCVDLSLFDVHGDVYAEAEFASFELSPDETELLYIAEKKPPKHSSSLSKNENGKGQNIYRENWGDQLQKRIHSVIARYSIEDNKIDILQGVPKDVCPGLVSYGPHGSYIVGVGYKTNPRKFGLAFCTNRHSIIFKLDFDGVYEQISAPDLWVTSPRFTLDGELLVWFQREAGGPHAGSLQLAKAWVSPDEDCEVEIIVDAVPSELDINGDKIFYGFFNVVVPQRCWAGGNRMVVSTTQKNEVKTYVVDIESKELTELEFEGGSQTVLDVFDDLLLANRRSFLVPDTLVVGRLPEKGEEASIEWIEISYPTVLTELDGLTHHYMDLSAPDTSEEIRSFSTIYVGPENGDDKEVPLIVYPHGGPHDAHVNRFSIEIALFASMGYGILLVNYRGSSGCGQDSLRHLVGRVGKSDVADCVLATVQAFIHYPWIDPNRAVLFGDSVVLHLAAHYPDMYKAVVAKNPVVDVASASTTSDSPDWCFAVTGCDYAPTEEPDLEVFARMRKVSPIQQVHKVKAPTLLCVGSGDSRVCWLHAREYYHRLKTNAVTARLNVYDDDHLLNKVGVEMDVSVNTVLWFEKYCASTNDDDSSDSD